MDKLTEQLEDGLPEFYEAKLVQGTRLVEKTVIKEMFEGAKQATRATRATRAEERRCIYPQRFVGFADSELKNVAGVVCKSSLEVP